jgi:hypothetical protein
MNHFIGIQTDPEQKRITTKTTAIKSLLTNV